MALRTGHGHGAGVPRVEVLPVDELPTGLQVAKQGSSTAQRTSSGRWAKGSSTAQRQGGLALKDKPRLARRLALGEAFADPAFEPYAQAAKAFRKAKVCDLARGVGGGHCGAGPASIVASASLQLAASRYAFEVLGDMPLGSKLANDSRQNLLAAHELCAREALARPKPTYAELQRQRIEEEAAFVAANPGLFDDEEVSQ